MNIHDGSDINRLAIDFFVLFSRMEYALKASGFHKGNGRAEANWTSFANSINGAFQALTDENLEEAKSNILDDPPNRQCVVNGQLDWEPINPGNGCDTDKLLLYVRGIRNNLFHGGKFNVAWADKDRAEVLLRSSIVILTECLNSSPTVRHRFSI